MEHIAFLINYGISCRPFVDVIYPVETVIVYFQYVESFGQKQM